MLNEKHKGEWRDKVRGIFTEAQKKFNEDLENGTMDLGAAPEEDPSIETPPSTDVVDPNVVEEEEPTVKVTASLLKALLDYCSAPDEEETDEVEVDAPVDETLVNPSMAGTVGPTNTGMGVTENAEVAPPATPEAPVTDAPVDAENGEDENGEEDEDVSTDEIVQRLIDLSAEKGDEALDVDVLAVVFAPAEPEGEDLGGELDNNVELPATTGDQTLPPEKPPVA